MLIKEQIADAIREEILAGRLAPGERIVESKWAARLRVAQGSIREAVNLLAAEGFIAKESGQTARVTLLTEVDIRQVYELRVVLEGLAARLAAASGAPIAALEQLLADMRSAAACNNARAYYERDLAFHARIWEMAGNRFLAQELQRLCTPLFAFYVMRFHAESATPWDVRIEEHARILEAVRRGDAADAERQTVASIQSLAGRARPAEAPVS